MSHTCHLCKPQKVLTAPSFDGEGYEVISGARVRKFDRQVNGRYHHEARPLARKQHNIQRRQERAWKEFVRCATMQGVLRLS